MELELINDMMSTGQVQTFPLSTRLMSALGHPVLQGRGFPLYHPPILQTTAEEEVLADPQADGSLKQLSV